MRTCIEIEANCKAILVENEYPRKGNLTIKDYKKINPSHRLSSYEVKVPYWRGSGEIRSPFAAWSDSKPLEWYQAYNHAKHDRHEKFSEATLDHALDAICALVVLLSAQFLTEDFAPSASYLSLSDSTDGFASAIGNYFRVRFPNDWPENDQYAFDLNDWNVLQNEADPFQSIAF